MLRALWVDDKIFSDPVLSNCAAVARRRTQLDISTDAASAFNLMAENQYDAVIVDMEIPYGIGWSEILGAQTEEQRLARIGGLQLINQAVSKLAYPLSQFAVLSVTSPAEVEAELCQFDASVLIVLEKTFRMPDEVVLDAIHRISGSRLDEA